MMEHLATFTVTKETGIVYPADGMRRLLQLEKSNGIWSQKMQLRLERNWVLIMDNETGVSSLLIRATGFPHSRRSLTRASRDALCAMALIIPTRSLIAASISDTRASGAR